MGVWWSHRRDESLVGLMLPGPAHPRPPAGRSSRPGLHRALGALLDELPGLDETGFVVIAAPGENFPMCN